MITSFLRKRRAFTLIELLLVIGIIAILASIVIVAINPTRQLGQARDAQRRSDVNTILNAVYQYSIDNNGQLPSILSGSNFTGPTPVCQGDTRITGACDYTSPGGYTKMVDLDALTGSYMVKVPRDPSLAANTATGTRYTISKANNRVTVASYGSEQTPAPGITVTR